MILFVEAVKSSNSRSASHKVLRIKGTYTNKQKRLSLKKKKFKSYF